MKELIIKELFSGVCRDDLFLEDDEPSVNKTYYKFCFWPGCSNGGFGTSCSSIDDYDTPFGEINYNVINKKIVSINHTYPGYEILPFYEGTLSEESLKIFKHLFVDLNVKYLPKYLADSFNLSEVTTNKPYYATIFIQEYGECNYTGEFLTLQELEELIKELSEKQIEYSTSCDDEFLVYNIELLSVDTCSKVEFDAQIKVEVTIKD